MPKIIRRSGAGASGAAGSGSTPGSLQITFSGSGQQGVAFSGSFVATGGLLPYTFSIFSGSLPTGLTLNTATGRISGTPSVVGVFNFTGRVTDAASTTADLACSVNIAQPSGASALIAVATTTGRDVGHSTDVADPVSRLVSFSVGAALTFASTPTQYNTIYLSQDAGTTWLWAGWWLWTASGQEFFFTVLRPPTAGTWKLAAVPGTIQGTNGVPILTVNLPAGRVFSSTFAVAALAAPAANLVTALSVTAGAGGSFPYNLPDADGAQEWSIASISFNDAVAAASPDAAFATLTAQDYDAAGSPIGVEHKYGSILITGGGNRVWGKLNGPYGSDANPARSGALGQVGLRLYLSSRRNQADDAWTDSTTSTLETSIGTGGLLLVVVAVGAAVPPGKLKGGRLDPNTIGSGLVLDPNNNYYPAVATNALAQSSLVDPGFEFSVPGTVITFPATLGAGSLQTNWLYLVPNSGCSVEVRNDGGNSGPNYVRLRGASAGVYQQIAVNPGLPLLLSVYARSSNNASVNHALNFVIGWHDHTGTFLSATSVPALSGHITNFALISGFVTAPANAGHANITYQTGASEPAGEYWDIDDAFLQNVTNQTGNSVQNTMSPVAGTSDYSVLRSLSTVDNSLSYYGKAHIGITAADGSAFTVDVGTNSAIMRVFNPSQVEGWQFQAGAGGTGVLLKTGGSSYTGIDAVFSGHTFKKGILVA